MAKGNPNPPPPPMHTRWKPGVSGNPGGLPKYKLTETSLRAIIDKCAQMSRKQLKAVMDHPESKMVELQVAAIMLKSVENADPSRMQFLLERFMGKVKDEVHQVIDAAPPPQIIVTLPSNGKEAPILAGAKDGCEP